ncbi:hypothetical protein TWF106_006801 [Orbilia oligospora]|uniref:Uncharacterized protein n=1 Tax=Orbilia oligospora TaxID=2813651 RepID=A0A7C8Q4C1_ORBOL|nr:hypothetical protein TWF106_006801 [Orbilia oligospora]
MAPLRSIAAVCSGASKEFPDCSERLRLVLNEYIDRVMDMEFGQWLDDSRRKGEDVSTPERSLGNWVQLWLDSATAEVYFEVTRKVRQIVREAMKEAPIHPASRKPKQGASWESVDNKEREYFSKVGIKPFPRQDCKSRWYNRAILL